MTERSTYIDRPVNLWTGDLVLELRNGRDWAAGTLEVAVWRDTLHVRHLGRTLAVLDRDEFRAWLIRPAEPHRVDDTEWSVSLGVTCLALRYSRYTVVQESLNNLLVVV